MRTGVAMARWQLPHRISSGGRSSTEGEAVTKPLTQAEIIRRLTVKTAARPTVRLWTTRDGVQVEVTVPDSTVEKAGQRAQAEFDRLRDRYTLEGLIDHETYDAAVADGTPFE